MTIDTIPRLVSDKMEQLTLRPVRLTWAVHAALCGRTFVLAAPAWQRWPQLKPKVIEGLQAALSRNIDEEGFRPSERVIADLENFDIEDDGSHEWQRAIDTITMISDVLKGNPPETCAKNALQWYLEGCYNIIANTAAMSRGGVISGSEAEKVVSRDPAWRAAVEFVAAL